MLPTSLVIINDIMAYLFGFFFGRTPLIKISPKKTWEGALPQDRQCLTASVRVALAAALSVLR